MNERTAAAVGLLLAGSLCLAPFLIPYHAEPFRSFYPEWAAAAIGVSAALALLVARRPSPNGRIPAPARWLLVLALFLVLRGASADSAYAQPSLLAGLYAIFAVLMIWIGAELVAALGRTRVATLLAVFLLTGALLNAAAGLVQSFGVPPLLEDFIAELNGDRAYGNIAQPNLYAEYLALGEGALLFLWLRGRVRTPFACVAAAVLVAGNALTGSRSVVLYALWYLAFAFIARGLEPRDARRLRIGAGALAAASILAYLVLPWGLSILHVGPHFERPPPLPGEYPEPRLGAFVLALRTFLDAPLLGAGIGGFPGRAYELGLDASLTRFGEVWTSPHNLPLHLLAETGLVGTFLGLGGLVAWGIGVVRSYRARPRLELAWVVASVGVILLHSMVEFPLWSAHFLAVAGLLVGASSECHANPTSIRPFVRWGAAALCAAIALSLSLLLRDYVRLDTVRITGTATTLASPDQADADAAVIRELARGLLAPLAERSIVLGAPLDTRALDERLATSERVARAWPAAAIIVRRSIFLAFAGKTREAESTLAMALRAFPQRREAVVFALEQASSADPTGIAPLLALARMQEPAPARSGFR